MKYRTCFQCVFGSQISHKVYKSYGFRSFANFDSWESLKHDYS